MYKLELHAHTSECDHVAKLGGAELVQKYREAGYHGIVITDHYMSLFFSSWFPDSLSETEHRTKIERYLRGYYAARNEGEKLGFTVLCGAELRFDHCINDYLIYGLEEEDLYRLPFLSTLKDVAALNEILPKNAVVVQAHPFRNSMVVKDPSPLFGIEVYNGGTEAFRNKMAKLFAEHYGKAMTSGSDIHNINALAKGGIITDHRIQTAADLSATLRGGNYSLITTDAP